MKRNIAALIAGVLFGVGLTISAMINPHKVLGFFDLFGNWDPSLIFVMGGGVVVTFIGYRLAFRRNEPLFAEAFPELAKGIDSKLLGGAVIFGIGWGMAGYCPGPALAALTVGGPKTIVFVVAMLAGMGVHTLWQRHLQAAT